MFDNRISIELSSFVNIIDEVPKNNTHPIDITG